MTDSKKIMNKAELDKVAGGRQEMLNSSIKPDNEHVIIPIEFFEDEDNVKKSPKLR